MIWLKSMHRIFKNGSIRYRALPAPRILWTATSILFPKIKPLNFPNFIGSERIGSKNWDFRFLQMLTNCTRCCRPSETKTRTATAKKTKFRCSTAQAQRRPTNIWTCSTPVPNSTPATAKWCSIRWKKNLRSASKRLQNGIRKVLSIRNILRAAQNRAIFYCPAMSAALRTIGWVPATTIQNWQKTFPDLKL